VSTLPIALDRDRTAVRRDVNALEFPGLASYDKKTAPIAQLVERQFCKLDVAGSIPARGSRTSRAGSRRNGFQVPATVGVLTHMKELGD
jgi:hypothetical protein